MAARRRLRVRYADGAEEEWPILEEDARALQRRACARPRAQRHAAYVFRGLVARPFWDADAVQGAPIARLRAALEARHAELADEAASLLRAGLLAEEEDALCWAPHSEGLHTGVWLKLALWGGGRVDDATCARLPVTAALLRGLASAADSPIMRDAPGCACLSLMLPGASVATHNGPTNHRRALPPRVLAPLARRCDTQPWQRLHAPLPRRGPAKCPAPRRPHGRHRLRLHLPLLLPDRGPKPRLRVAGVDYEWVRGKCVVFDDSFEHSVHFPRDEHTGAGASAARADRRGGGSGPPRKRAHGGAARAAADCHHHGGEQLTPDSPSSSAAAGGDDGLLGVVGGVRVLLILDLWHPQFAAVAADALARAARLGCGASS